MHGTSSVAAGVSSGRISTGLSRGFGNLRTALRVVQRSVRLAAHLLCALPLSALLLLGNRSRYPIAHRCCRQLNQFWQRRLLRILGVHVDYSGGLPVPGTLCVPNHISWIDPVVIGSVANARFVSKAEIRSWPLIGWLAVANRTLFIRRGQHDTARVNEQLCDSLAAKDVAVVFAEATTTDGKGVSYYFPRLLASAQQAHAWVQPVMIHYRGSAEAPSVAPYVDNMCFLPHLLNLLKQPATHVELRFLRAYAATAWSRRELASLCRRDVSRQLGCHASPRQEQDVDLKTIISKLRSQNFTYGCRQSAVTVTKHS